MWQQEFKPKYLRLSLHCGASSQQTQIEQAQANFYNTLTSEYGTVFAQNQAILGQLTKAFEPILAAGINQEGFSAAEKQNLESTATTGTGQAFQAASEALAKEQAVQGGGTTFIPSGAEAQQREELATSAARNVAGEESQIEQANYATGRQNYLEAAGILGGVANQENPAAFAGATTGAGNAAAQTAEQITQSQNSWLNLASGAIGAAGTAAGGYFQNH